MYMLAGPILTLWPPMRILEVMQTLFHCQPPKSTTLNHLRGRQRWRGRREKLENERNASEDQTSRDEPFASTEPHRSQWPGHQN
jgi:hypothetical protein